ncbi:MAG: glycoside hydrolase family 3 protein [Colwellia sp.]
MKFSDFEHKIAQKMALDIRYFCQQAPEDEKICRQPVTQLPIELADMITATSIGSIVLFAENLESSEQILHLTRDLQQASLQSTIGKPLIISVDQEGGRVVRLPHATSFSGNMAIGATYPSQGDKFASQVNGVIANELNALGINNNYAPVVDVNTNAKNPVINTRSFGENPQQVAELGIAAVKAIQQQGVMATLKHFPGHGDTHVDSHAGLPRVEHDLATIEKYDLAPFQSAIEQSDPAMIMTAHIQYPALDNSTVTNKEGIETIRPATMSRKILTDLLRVNMGFDGIIATDALDMAGIAHYFDPVTATVETFKAGADLAVMPFKIRTIADIEQFKIFIKLVSKALGEAIIEKQFNENEIDQSLARINYYKAKYIHLSKQTLAEQIHQAEQVIAQKSSLLLEQALSNNAVTLIKNEVNFLPIDNESTKQIHLLVATQHEFIALEQAIKDNWQKRGLSPPTITAIIADSANAFRQIQDTSLLSKVDIVIATIDSKIASAVDFGGVDDLLTQTMNNKQAVIKQSTGNIPSISSSGITHTNITNTNITNASDEFQEMTYGAMLEFQLALAKQHQLKTLLVAKSSPYLIAPYIELADAVLLTFDDRIYSVADNKMVSPGFNTAMAIVIGNQKAKGVLPVKLSK